MKTYVLIGFTRERFHRTEEKNKENKQSHVETSSMMIFLAQKLANMGSLDFNSITNRI